MKIRSMRVLAATMVAGLVLAACGGADDAAPAPDTGGDTADDGTDAADDTDDTDEDAGDDGSADAGGPPSLPDLQMTFEAERTTQLMNLLSAKERTWNDTFESVTMTATEEPIPALVSGAAWLVQNEPTLLWPALEQGIVDGVIVGVFNDQDAWFLFSREGFDTPESLIGARFSGGSVGDSWNTVGEIIMREEFGIDPAEVEFVSVGGGSDSRAEALLAGQIDAFMGQPRHIPLVEEAGGYVLFGEFQDMAQGMFLVTRETMANHKDAVCAALGGLFEANQWISSSSEPDWGDRIEPISEYLTINGFDPSENGLDVVRTWETGQDSQFNWALDLGAPAEAFDRQQEILSREGGEISADFDWRDWVDFSCIWELQEAAGLPLNPDPNDL
jgi:ABC-type nitrate/sulfonate/bicarbonate transport system substrate-binding protein